MAFGGLSLLAAITASFIVSQVAVRRIQADIGAEFAAAAERIADLLDRGLQERLRDIQVAASLAPISDETAPVEARRALLRRLQETYPDYAILIFIRPDGTIQASSNGLLEGVNVAGREYFQRGRGSPTAVDVHEAVLLGPLFGRGAEDPLRFIDVAAPAHGPDGQLVGVVAAHLFWEWAEKIEREVMRPILARHAGAQAFVLSQQGTVLLGPREFRAAAPWSVAPGAAAALAARQTGSRVESGGGKGAAFLIGFAATQGPGAMPGLGWNVLVRHDADLAFAPARRLAREVMGWGAVAALLAAALGWLLAGAMARPLVQLSQAALRLQAGPEATDIPTGQGPREVVSLAAALQGLVVKARHREAALRNGEALLRVATEGAGIGVWQFDLATGRCTRSARHDAIFGYAAPLSEWGLRDFLAHVHPEERAAARQACRQALAAGQELSLACRIRRGGDGAERWIELRGAPLRDPDHGRITHYAGVVEDVTEREAAARALELLVRELDHRVKNQFAVFDGLVQFTARGCTAVPAMAQALRGRIQALAAAHDLVRDATGSGAARGLRPTTLQALLEAILGAFAPATAGAPQEGRLRLDGPAVTVGPLSAAALALVVHELATNAARHGALSCAEGRVAVSWSATPEAITLLWVESGGPPLAGKPDRQGFGTALLRQGAERQLGGRLALDWARAEGLSVSLRLPPHRLAR